MKHVVKPVVLGLTMALSLGQALAQQVWRCEQDGLVRYTDQPCEKTGRPLPARQLKANIADGLASEIAPAAPPASAASDPAEPADGAELPAAAPAAGEAASAAAQPAPVIRRSPRGRQVMRVAWQGLMNTDFVQRGYVPRRQNPAFTSNP